MNTIQRDVVTVALLGLFLMSCGKNPFGPGAAGGLSIFAKIGKALGKPSAIHEEENGKEGSKNAVAKRLAKGFSTQAAEPWIISSGIETSHGDTLIYFEVVNEKPDENEPAKLSTGRGEVAFKYNGIYSGLTTFNPGLITDIYSYKFVGREIKTWKSEICTVRVTINFSEGNLQIPSTIKPGYTEAWGKNISASLDVGQGDTAFFTLDSLDDVNHIQFGEGHFLDAHTGKDNSEAARPFDFRLQILHKNSVNTDLPYLRYEDNEGVMTFTYPWGETGDSLYFTLQG